MNCFSIRFLHVEMNIIDGIANNPLYRGLLQVHEGLPQKITLTKSATHLQIEAYPNILRSSESLGQNLQLRYKIPRIPAEKLSASINTMLSPGSYSELYFMLPPATVLPEKLSGELELFGEHGESLEKLPVDF